ncbi:MAG: hypothetical protein C9356_15785 [Oleiphilus sp.]|nr:MAG: hypothetical protein C9356_15785 [Oleiphilus sp.]
MARVADHVENLDDGFQSSMYLYVKQTNEAQVVQTQGICPTRNHLDIDPSEFNVEQKRNWKRVRRRFLESALSKPFRDKVRKNWLEKAKEQATKAAQIAAKNQVDDLFGDAAPDPQQLSVKSGRGRPRTETFLDIERVIDDINNREIKIALVTKDDILEYAPHMWAKVFEVEEKRPNDEGQPVADPVAEKHYNYWVEKSIQADRKQVLANSNAVATVRIIAPTDVRSATTEEFADSETARGFLESLGFVVDEVREKSTRFVSQNGDRAILTAKFD